MDNVIVILVIVAIIGAAVTYIVKEKKRGVRCVGCPDGGCACKNGAVSGGCSGCNGNCSQ